MNDVRGVADQRQPLADERARGEQPERKGAARPDHFDVAEMQAEALLQLGVKFLVGQRDDALGLARGFGPHDRRALSRERQDRERPGGQEMFLGAAVVLALVRHRGDDRRLIVIPAMRGDAGLFADLRARAVGADQKPRGNRLAVGELERRSHDRAFAKPLTAPARRSTPSSFAFATSASTRCRFSTMCANGSPGSTSPPKVRKVGRTASSSFAVGHHHVEDRLRVARRPRPRPRSPRTAAARPPRSPRRAGPSIARPPAPGPPPSPRRPRPAPGAARSPAPGRQSRPRRSPRRVAGFRFAPSIAFAPARPEAAKRSRYPSLFRHLCAAGGGLLIWIKPCERH